MKKRTPRVLTQQAQEIIADVYLVGSVPADPPLVLTDIARSVSVVGRMMDGLADRYGTQGKGFARAVTIAGSVLWGIVQIAVPDRVLSRLSRNWYALFVLSGVVIIALGLLTNTPGMASIGAELIFAVFVLRLIVAALRQYMNTGDACGQAIRMGIVAVVVVAAVGLLAYLVVLHSRGIAGWFSCLAQLFTSLSRHIPKLLQPRP